MADLIDLTERAKDMVPGTQWIWRGAAAALLLAGALLSYDTIQPGEVAVRVNNVTGARESITQPGFVITIPFVHSLYLLDAAPQTFTMKGDQGEGLLNVRELTVRASDGSNFHFDEVSLVFQVKGAEAATAVEDSGQGTGFQRWIKPYARSVLRDEFGRESTIDVSNPTTYAAATNRSKTRLNELLETHGVVITQLVTPRPRFNQAYEGAIEERNKLTNEIEVIGSRLARAETARKRALAQVDQEKNKEIQTKRVALETSLAEAVANQAEKKREADTYRIASLGDGQAALSSSTKKAEQLAGELNANYEARRAEIEAFKTQPVERVMERLGETLKGVTINIQPYANDASPTRVKLDQ